MVRASVFGWRTRPLSVTYSAAAAAVAACGAIQVVCLYLLPSGSQSQHAQPTTNKEGSTHSFRTSWDRFACQADTCAASSDKTKSLRFCSEQQAPISRCQPMVYDASQPAHRPTVNTAPSSPIYDIRNLIP